MRFAAILLCLVAPLGACQGPAEPGAQQPGSFAVHLNGRYTAVGRIVSSGSR
jgi:hypothetical protein